MKRNLMLTAAVAALLAGTAPSSAQGLFGLFPTGGAESTNAFRAEALRSDAYQIEAGRMAAERSRDPRVRAYARRQIRDHQETTRALLPEGTSLNAGGTVVADNEPGLFSSPLTLVTAPLTVPVNIVGRTLSGQSPIADATPGEPGRRVALDPRRQAKLQELSAARGGRTFSETYVRQQVEADREQVALYQGYARNGSDETGRAFAGQALPVLQGHAADSARLDERYARSAEAF